MIKVELLGLQSGDEILIRRPADEGVTYEPFMFIVPPTVQGLQPGDHLTTYHNALSMNDDGNYDIVVGVVFNTEWIIKNGDAK